MKKRKAKAPPQWEREVLLEKERDTAKKAKIEAVQMYQRAKEAHAVQAELPKIAQFVHEKNLCKTTKLASLQRNLENWKKSTNAVGRPRRVRESVKAA